MVTSFATISSSFAWLPERQLPPICYALVLGHSFGFGCLQFLLTGSHLTLGTIKLMVCAWRYGHMCTHMPAYANPFTRMSAHSDKCSFSHYTTAQTHPQQTTHTPLHTCTCKHMRVYPPAHPALPHLTHKQPGICHQGGHTYTHAHAHANTNTHRHTNAVLLSAPCVPFWPFDRYTEDLKVRGEASEQVYKSETCPLHR